MKQLSDLKIEGEKVQNLLSDFFLNEKRKHKKDGGTALESLDAVHAEVQRHEAWGKLVLVPLVCSKRKASNVALSVAAAFELLVTTLALQFGKASVSRGLSVDHFPIESRGHAQKSIQIVLGDLALMLMHNLLLEIPEHDSVVLSHEQKFSQLARHIFSQGIISNKKDKIFSALFAEAIYLGLSLVSLKKQKRDVLLRAIKKFHVDMKKESALADSFYSLVEISI